MKRLLNSAKETQPELHALDTLAVTTGMRSGGLLGLQWHGVDLEARTLLVNRTVLMAQINTPKASKSRLSIKLAKIATRALNQQQRNGECVICIRAGTLKASRQSFRVSFELRLHLTSGSEPAFRLVGPL